MRKNKFKSFASRLNKDGDHPEKISFESPEEQAEYDKLTFSGTDVSPKKRVNRIYGQKCRQK